MVSSSDILGKPHSIHVFLYVPPDSQQVAYFLFFHGINHQLLFFLVLQNVPLLFQRWFQLSRTRMDSNHTSIKLSNIYKFGCFKIFLCTSCINFRNLSYAGTQLIVISCLNSILILNLLIHKLTLLLYNTAFNTQVKIYINAHWCHVHWKLASGITNIALMPYFHLILMILQRCINEVNCTIGLLHAKHIIPLIWWQFVNCCAVQ